jgi:hypothetical protein
MERFTKVLVVLVLVAALGTTASAADNYGKGGDWASGAGWYYGAPTAAQSVYSYLSTVTNPTILAAGDTGALNYLRMDIGGAWEPGGKAGLVINGTVNMGDSDSFDGLYFGGDSGGLVLQGAEIVIGSTGVMNTTFIKVTDQGIAEATYDMWIAGALNVTGIYDATWGWGYIDYIAEDESIADLNLVLTDLDAIITIASGEAAGLISNGLAQTNIAGKTVGIIADDGTTATIGIVPEPATLALLGLGALVLRRKK